MISPAATMIGAEAGRDVAELDGVVLGVCVDVGICVAVAELVGLGMNVFVGVKRGVGGSVGNCVNVAEFVGLDVKVLASEAVERGVVLDVRVEAGVGVTVAVDIDNPVVMTN